MASDGKRATTTWTRLLVIAAVPIMGLASFAGLEGAARWKTVRSNASQQAGVERLATYTTLSNDLTQETYLVAATAYGARFHLDETGVSKLIGTDVNADMKAARAQLDRQFDRLAPGDPLLKYRSQIDSVRSAFDSHSGSLENLTFRLGTLSSNISGAANGEQSAITDRAMVGGSSGRMLRALVVLSASHLTAQATYLQLGQLSGIIFDRSNKSIRTMRLATAELNQGQAELSRLATGRVGDAWHALLQDKAVHANEERFATLADGEISTAAALPLADAAATISSGMARLTKYEQLADLSAREAVAQADAERHGALTALRNTLGAALLLILLTIGLAIAVARSVARRLSQATAAQDELTSQLAFDARHDALTGLPNRAAATEEIGRALSRARRWGTSLALLYIDLDGFKHVNDNLGHGAGDTLLQGTAERLTAAVRDGDFAARIGGDEFLVITEQAADAADVVALGKRLVTCLSEPVSIGRGMTRVGASIGIAFALDAETNADRLLRDADLAGYRAKASGRGRVEVFDEGLREEVSRQVEIESALRTALERDELELHFQPVVSAGGQVNAAEALIRWYRPGFGIVPPNDFIPIAESSDLIIDVGRWVLDRACRYLNEWSEDEVLADLAVAVNLSGRHLLNVTVVDDVRAALQRHGVESRRLTVEITETTVLTDVAVVTEHLEALRAMGVEVAIDDFGTGYTSLAHLRALPVDVLKIDRSMIVHADRAPDAHVLALLIDTAHALGLRLVAEGVETTQQLDRVQSLGCQSVQGYLFSKPLPADEFCRYLYAAPALS